MAKYVPDTYTNRWVIFATKRAFRPDEHQITGTQKPKGKHAKLETKQGYNYLATCPFCFGNEHLTPPEVTRWSSHDGHEQLHPNHHWLVRVIPNRFPIADIHEVVIHGPDHRLSFTEIPEYHAEAIFKVFLQRFQILSQKGTVIIFNNQGPESGESLTHPHSQIVVLPKQIKLEVISLQPVNYIVEETAHYYVYCPDFSQWPYEVWVSLKKFHEPSFVDHDTAHFDTITDEELIELSKVMQKILNTIRTKFSNISYNYYIHPYSPWYVRIVPRFVTRAGFELGTGIYVNIKDPAVAAKELKTTND